MIRVMFDSVHPAAIPTWAPMVAGYVDGRYAWKAADWERFPHAQHVQINVTGDPSYGGDCLDVENGDATPDHAPGWYDARHAAGVRDLAIYCNRGNLAAVNAAMGTRPFYRWVATLDGTLAIDGHPPLVSPAAVQFAGSSAVGGLPLDVSLVFEPSWHPVPERGSALTVTPQVLADAKQLAALITQVRSLDDTILHMLGG